MSPSTIIVIEILLSFSVSFAVIVLLRPLLLEVLRDICGSGERAAFWVRYSQVLLVIAPMLMVIYFAPEGALEMVVNPVASLKDSLFLALLGNFIAMLIIGRVIRNSVISGFGTSPKQLPQDAIQSGRANREA